MLALHCYPVAHDDLKKELLRVLQDTHESHAQGQAVLKKGLEQLQAGQDQGRLARELVEQNAIDKKHLELLKTTFQARRAGCIERCLSGSGRGSWKRAER